MRLQSRLFYFHRCRNQPAPNVLWQVPPKETAMAYVDGFVIAVPKSKLDTYKAMARHCEPIWREFGAIDYVECAGDDTPYGEVTSFPRAVQAKDDETVIFSWIVYPDRTTRD